MSMTCERISNEAAALLYDSIVSTNNLASTGTLESLRKAKVIGILEPESSLIYKKFASLILRVIDFDPCEDVLLLDTPNGNDFTLPFRAKVWDRPAHIDLLQRINTRMMFTAQAMAYLKKFDLRDEAWPQAATHLIMLYNKRNPPERKLNAEKLVRQLIYDKGDYQLKLKKDLIECARVWIVEQLNHVRQKLVPERQKALIDCLRNARGKRVVFIADSEQGDPKSSGHPEQVSALYDAIKNVSYVVLNPGRVSLKRLENAASNEKLGQGSLNWGEADLTYYSLNPLALSRSL